MTPCPRCGYEHPFLADRLACHARHGRRFPVEIGLEVRNPYVICALCGAGGELDLILDHMQTVESHREVSSGRLIRTISDTEGL